MTAPRDATHHDAQADLVRRLLHQLAQPLAGAALALDIALLAESHGDSEEVRLRLNGAVEAIDQAQAILRAWSAHGMAPVAGPIAQMG
jgi:hypothetical protein